MKAFIEFYSIKPRREEHTFISLTSNFHSLSQVLTFSANTVGNFRIKSISIQIYQWCTIDSMNFVRNCFESNRHRSSKVSEQIFSDRYLANDFQFHLLAPMLLLPLIFNKRRLSYILIGLVLLGNILTRLTIILKNPGFENGFVENDSLVMNFFNRVYITPWCRIGPFLIGMLTKLFLDQCEGRFSRLNTVFFSSMSIFSAIFCIFFPFYSNEFGRWAKIFYQTSSNVCWSISLAWFIIVCSIHPSMKIKRFLSMSIWLIIARLSYSAYLIHPIVILTEIYNRSTTIHYQASVIFNGFAGQTLLTLFVSLITVILVESPILNVEKRIRNVFRQKTFVHFQRSAYGTIN